MNIELRPLAQIKPYDKNPRHNDEAVDAVAASLTEFGFRQPIVVDGEGVIVVGHTRYKAAQKLGIAEVPVHVATDLTPAQAKAYRIADNQTATIATWDKELLPLELRGLQEMDFDLNTLGFDEEELARWLPGDPTLGLTDPDAVPEPPDKAITQPGDLWVLGNHRLLCGDSSKTEDVDRLLDGAKVQLANTDPPYNVNVEPRSNVAIAAGLSSFPATETSATKGARKLRAKDRSIANDKMSDEEFDKLLRKWFGNIARVLEPGRGFYIWGGYGNIGSYPPALKESELYFSQAIVWIKEHPVMNRKDFMGNFELAYYGWREGAGHKWFGPNNVTDVWSVKKVPSQQMLHLTQKPVELAVRAMQYSSLVGENVLDLFGGSGSTLIGAEQTGRKAYLMELDALYCDLIVQRWETFSGKRAQCEPTAQAAC